MTEKKNLPDMGGSHSCSRKKCCWQSRPVQQE